MPLLPPQQSLQMARREKPKMTDRKSLTTRVPSAHHPYAVHALVLAMLIAWSSPSLSVTARSCGLADGFQPQGGWIMIMTACEEAQWWCDFPCPLYLWRVSSARAAQCCGTRRDDSPLAGRCSLPPGVACPSPP